MAKARHPLSQGHNTNYQENTLKIIALDIEATGPNPYRDRIIEICLMRVDQGKSVVLFNNRIKPDMPISPTAAELTGITNEDVATYQGFGSCAQEIQEHIEGAVLLGYSNRAFDSVILDQELRRHDQPGIDLDTVQEIDLYRVLQEMEPRTLVGTVKRFLNIDHDGAHGALADTEVLEPVMDGMLLNFELTIEEMAKLSRPEWEVDRSGKLRKDESGVVIWNFGAYRGEPVTDHPDYIDWVLSRDFPPDTNAVLKQILEEMYAEEDDCEEEDLPFVDPDQEELPL